MTHTHPQYSPDGVRWFADIDLGLCREWSRPHLDRASGTCPHFGSREWAALPDGHPDKTAAVIFAALRWAEAHTIEALTEQAEVNEYFDRSALKQASLVMSEMWQERSRYQETFAELRRRRAVVPPVREIDPVAVARWVATGSSEPAQEETAA